MPAPNALDHVFTGRRRTATDTGARLGEFVVSAVLVAADGTVSVRFKDPTTHQEYRQPAPCPAWTDAAAGTGPHTHVMAGPVVGYRCLIAFVGSGIDRPWCLSWSST